MEPGQQEAPFPVTGLLFDLDDTLYDVPAMKAQVATNIQRYMVAKLGVSEDEVVELCFRCVWVMGKGIEGRFVWTPGCERWMRGTRMRGALWQISHDHYLWLQVLHGLRHHALWSRGALGGAWCGTSECVLPGGRGAGPASRRFATFRHTHSPTYNISQAQGHHIDTEDWHAFVHHTLPYEEYLRPDPALRRMLSDIPYPMCVGRERRSGV